jgi:beta-lactamase class A
MSKKKPEDLMKKAEIKQTVKNNNWKRIRIVFYITILLVGFIIGWSLDYYIYSHNKQNSTLYKNITKDDSLNYEQKSYKHLEFINPYAQSPLYNKVYYDEQKSFKDLIEHYCIKAKMDKSINQISVYFRDMTTGAWFGVNDKEKYVPASLTKVPILIAVLKKAECNPLYWKKRLTYKGSFTETYLKAHPEINDIRTPMNLNESYSIEQLCNLMITKSDNEAAYLLYDDIGPDYWNAFEERLGNKLLIDGSSAANIITVKGYSTFFRILYNANLLSREYSNKALEILSRSEYDKGIRLAVPSNIVVSHKFGERDTIINTNELKIQQLHHAGIVYYPGKPYFICIMTRGSDKIMMEKILYDISKITYQVQKRINILKKTALVGDIE